MTYHPRSDWTSVTAADAHRLSPLYVRGAAVHWNGPAVPVSALLDPRAFLEGVRRYHVNVNGWSDIAYNLAVDQTGDVWELRGLRHMSAANGDTEQNTRWLAVFCIIGQGQTPSDAMLAGIRDAVALVRRVYPAATGITTHRAIRPEPTACPGDDLTRAVDSGALEPREDDDVTIQELVDALRDNDHPLTKQLRRHMRETVQAELKDEREGNNP